VNPACIAAVPTNERLVMLTCWRVYDDDGQVRDVMFWFPPLDGAAVSVSFLTYAGQLYMSIVADRAVLPDPDFISTAFVAEVNTRTHARARIY